MSDWLISLEGTEAGRTLALCLALLAAVLHALFGALQKGRTDPWTARTVIDASYSAMAVPFLFVVPLPEPHLWPLLAIAWVIHVGYKMAQAATYSVGSYMVVYPVVRGTSPVFTVIGAGFLFGEVFQPLQWLGVALLVVGIFGFSAYNLSPRDAGPEPVAARLGVGGADGRVRGALHDMGRFRDPRDGGSVHLYCLVLLSGWFGVSAGLAGASAARTAVCAACGPGLA